MADKWLNDYIEIELGKTSEMKLKTLAELLQHDAVLVNKYMDVEIYQIRNDKYVVMNEKVIHKYKLDYEKLRGDYLK